MSRAGAIVRRVTDDGLELTLYPMLFGNVRLCAGDPDAGDYDRGWCYHAQHQDAAVEDVATWDGTSDDPPGSWYRSLQTDERREEFA